MEKELGVYKLNLDYGRAGSLTGLFIASKAHIQYLIANKIGVYFGEVLGKHSEIFSTLKESDIIFVSDKNEIVDIIHEFDLSNGFNPFDYQVYGQEDAEDENVFDYIDRKMNALT